MSKMSPSHGAYEKHRKENKIFPVGVWIVPKLSELEGENVTS